jgi:hypothetical protein
MKQPLNLPLSPRMLKDCMIYGFGKCVGRQFTAGHMKYMALRIHKRLAYKTGKTVGVEIQFNNPEIKFIFEIDKKPHRIQFTCNLEDHTLKTSI